jgi:hypothetical protein
MPAALLATDVLHVADVLGLYPCRGPRAWLLHLIPGRVPSPIPSLFLGGSDQPDVMQPLGFILDAGQVVGGEWGRRSARRRRNRTPAFSRSLGPARTVLDASPRLPLQAQVFTLSLLPP